MTNKYLVIVRVKDYSIIVDAENDEDALMVARQQLNATGADYDMVEDAWKIPDEDQHLYGIK